MKSSSMTSHYLVEGTISTARILLVEDELINQKFALHILKKLGYKVESAFNGMEAIERLGSDWYDLVLMDIQMPIMDGYEATRIIRDSSSHVLNHDIPIIAMTARWSETDRGRCLEKGMDDYLAKPVEPKRLLKIINLHLSNGNGALKPSGFHTQTLYEDTRTEGPKKDDPIFKKLLHMYIERLPLQIKELKQALDENNANTIRELGHTIKGGSALIEAASLRDYALEIENAGKNRDMESAREFIGRLEGEYEKFLNNI